MKQALTMCCSFPSEPAARIMSLVLLLLVVFISGTIRQQVLAHPALARSSGWGGLCGNSEPPNDNNNSNNNKRAHFRASSLPDPKRKWRNRQELANITDRLSRELIHVRLNVVYDKALEEKHQGKPGGVQAFIRDLVYATQLIYEQPEMRSRLKINLVVVSTKLSSLQIESSWTSNVLLDKFSEAPEGLNSDTSDLSVLMIYRTMGSLKDVSQMLNPDPRHKSKTLGLANFGSFCHHNWDRPKSMVLSAGSLGYAPVFAHELAHSLNVDHDGRRGSKIEERCGDNGHLMAPAVSADNLRWSHCSVEAMSAYFSEEQVANCIYDPKRIAKAQPMSAHFDLNPSTEAGSSNRRSLPGELVPNDEQCARYVDKRARSALTVLGREQGSFYTSCQDLVCHIGRSFHLSIGPAPPGSACKNHGSSKLGRCFEAHCESTS